MSVGATSLNIQEALLFFNYALTANKEGKLRKEGPVDMMTKPTCSQCRQYGPVSDPWALNRGKRQPALQDKMLEDITILPLLPHLPFQSRGLDPCCPLPTEGHDRQRVSWAGFPPKRGHTLALHCEVQMENACPDPSSSRFSFANQPWWEEPRDAMTLLFLLRFCHVISIKTQILQVYLMTNFQLSFRNLFFKELVSQ